MKYNYKYNKQRDRAQVVPGLSICLKEAVETGAIKDTGYIPEYNQIEDNNKILGRIRDNFEAVEAMRFVSKYGKSTPKDNIVTPSTNTSQPSEVTQP